MMNSKHSTIYFYVNEMAFLKPKTEDQIEKMYELINENDLIHDTVDRELMNTILDKMIETEKHVQYWKIMYCVTESRIA